MFPFGGAWSLVWGAKPPKAPLGDGTDHTVACNFFSLVLGLDPRQRGSLGDAVVDCKLNNCGIHYKRRRVVYGGDGRCRPLMTA